MSAAALALSAVTPHLSFASFPGKTPLLLLPRRRLRVSSIRAFADTQRRPMRTTATAPASLYEVLQVKTNASQMEIKTAYRSLAKLYHPDASSSSSSSEEESDGHEFIEIHNAYTTLSDPAARAMYDLSLSAGVQCDRRRSGVGVGFRPNGFYSTRRWETDQCW